MGRNHGDEGRKSLRCERGPDCAPGPTSSRTVSMAMRATIPNAPRDCFAKALAIDPDEPVVMKQTSQACARKATRRKRGALTSGWNERIPTLVRPDRARELAAMRGDLRPAKKLLSQILKSRKACSSPSCRLCVWRRSMWALPRQADCKSKGARMLRSAAPGSPNGRV